MWIIQTLQRDLQLFLLLSIILVYTPQGLSPQRVRTAPAMLCIWKDNWNWLWKGIVSLICNAGTAYTVVLNLPDIWLAWKMPLLRQKPPGLLKMAVMLLPILF